MNPPANAFLDLCDQAVLAANLTAMRALEKDYMEKM